MSVVGAAAASSPAGWAVVTGASSGLGREFARALGERGYQVLAVARRRERLSALADDVEGRGGRLDPLVADLSTSAGIDALLARAAERQVELLVNNAGVATYGPFASAPADGQRGLVRLNVETIVALTRALLPQMLVRGRGGVINVASQMAFQPMPYFAAYAASKAFVLSFSEALSEELRGTGVTITAVAPGFVSTEFTEVAGSGEPERRLPHLEPRRVVESALRAHERGRTVTVVGPFYEFLTFAGRFAPRALLRRMMGRQLRPGKQHPNLSPDGPPPRSTRAAATNGPAMAVGSASLAPSRPTPPLPSPTAGDPRSKGGAMQHHRNLPIPDTLADVCDPDRMALLVYDMQVGVVSQLADGPQVIGQVRRVLEAARRAGVRIFFTRHMTLPTELMGISQLRSAMAWQHKDRVEDVVSPFLRESPGFEIVPELAPSTAEAVFDKLSMSAFEGTPLDFALRDAQVAAFAIVGVATEVGIEPTVRHGADLGLIPVVVTDACGAGDHAAAKRSLDVLATAGDAILTDIAAIAGVLARPTMRQRGQRGPEAAAEDATR